MTMIQRLLPLMLLLSLSTAALCQDVPEALRPPKGATLALVVFEDLQCPNCSRTAPVVAQAGRTYKIPVVRYDFPLPNHNWSLQAAVIAHYFDSHSKALGNSYRDYIFEHQIEILPTTLRSFSEKFAAEHKVPLPFAVDPTGKFAAEVNAEKEIGIKLGLTHTPTIYVVSTRHPGKPYVEVKDAGELYAMIDSMK